MHASHKQANPSWHFISLPASLFEGAPHACIGWVGNPQNYINKRRNTLVSKATRFWWFRMVSGSKRCPKKALATDRRQRRHELSREEIPAGKIPRISPSWAKNGKIRQSWGMGGEDLRQSRAYFPRIAMCIKREKTRLQVDRRTNWERNENWICSRICLPEPACSSHVASQQSLLQVRPAAPANFAGLWEKASGFQVHSTCRQTESLYNAEELINLYLKTWSKTHTLHQHAS